MLRASSSGLSRTDAFNLTVRLLRETIQSPIRKFDLPFDPLDINFSTATAEASETASSDGYVSSPQIVRNDLRPWYSPSITSIPSDTASIRPGQSLISDSSVESVSDKAATPSSISTGSGWHTRPQGWHVGTIVCAVTATIVFLINLVLTTWAAANYGVQEGIGTIHDGSCSRTKNMSLWLHLAINVLSTTLLGASNYCMQCLSAPTRKEMDRAHQRCIRLDIGVPSVRNLRFISWKRSLLWLLLVSSSVPLHLFYNSAVFSTLSAREYTILAISPSLARGESFNASGVLPDNSTAPSRPPGYFSQTDLIEYGLRVLKNSGDKSLWQHLETKQCIQAYRQEFMSVHGDVLIVSSALDDSYPIEYIDTSIPKARSAFTYGYNWMCQDYKDWIDYITHGFQFVNGQCELTNLSKASENWRIRDFPVNSCLSFRAEEHCRLQFSLPLLILVTVCNLIKAAGMILMTCRRDADPLVTLGDTIASFLTRPDATTRENCLATKYWFQRREWGRRTKPWGTRKHSWFWNGSWGRWLGCNLL
ncbi:MAG: hypothetical protein Q9201_005196 [Fulgogasparrea decipioides]